MGKYKIYLGGFQYRGLVERSLRMRLLFTKGEFAMLFVFPILLVSRNVRYRNYYYLGGGNVDIGARIRYDNSCVAEHVHSIKSVTKVRGKRGVPESNKEESDTSPRLALS